MRCVAKRNNAMAKPLNINYFDIKNRTIDYNSLREFPSGFYSTTTVFFIFFQFIKMSTIKWGGIAAAPNRYQILSSVIVYTYSESLTTILP